MKTITKRINAYSYDELSDQAKQNAMDNSYEYSSMIASSIIEDYLVEKIKDLFVCSYNTLEYQYDCSGSQGSGFNLYGKYSIADFLDKFSKSYIGEDTYKKLLIAIENNGNFDVTVKVNNYYSYFKGNFDTIFEELNENLDSEFSYEELIRLSEDIYKILKEICNDLYRDCYTIYDNEISSFPERAREEEYLFDENGYFICTEYDLDDNNTIL